MHGWVGSFEHFEMKFLHLEINEAQVHFVKHADLFVVDWTLSSRNP